MEDLYVVDMHEFHPYKVPAMYIGSKRHAGG